jgi:hypothetical protein
MWSLLATLLTTVAAASLQHTHASKFGTPRNPLGTAAHSRERFVGGLMGVHADVTLCMDTKHAAIKLSGIPLGGTLEGTARFSDDEGSIVVVDEPLRTSLHRRFVNIVGVNFDRERDKVYVTVKLPFLLGTRTIMMGRAADDEGSDTVGSTSLYGCTPPAF